MHGLGAAPGRLSRRAPAGRHPGTSQQPHTQPGRTSGKRSAASVRSKLAWRRMPPARTRAASAPRWRRTNGRASSASSVGRRSGSRCSRSSLSARSSALKQAGMGANLPLRVRAAASWWQGRSMRARCLPTVLEACTSCDMGKYKVCAYVTWALHKQVHARGRSTAKLVMQPIDATPLWHVGHHEGHAGGSLSTCRVMRTPFAHLMMRTVMAPRLLPSNARRSAHSSYNMHPSAHTSVAVPYGRPCGGGSRRSARYSALLAAGVGFCQAHRMRMRVHMLRSSHPLRSQPCSAWAMRGSTWPETAPGAPCALALAPAAPFSGLSHEAHAVRQP